MIQHNCREINRSFRSLRLQTNRLRFFLIHKQLILQLRLTHRDELLRNHKQHELKFNM